MRRPTLSRFAAGAALAVLLSAGLLPGAAVAASASASPTATASAQWVNPLPGAQTTSCYGQRWGVLHAGVDLAAAEGTDILAVGAGTVIAAEP